MRGKIKQVTDAGHVLLELPDEFQDAEGTTFATATERAAKSSVVIPAEHHSGSGMRVGNTRWIEVVAIHASSTRRLVEVKPIPSPVQKGK